MKERIQKIIDGWDQELHELHEAQQNHKMSSSIEVYGERESRIQLIEQHTVELEKLLKPEVKESTKLDKEPVYIPELWYG